MEEKEKPYFLPHLGFQFDENTIEDTIKNYVDSNRSHEISRKMDFWMNRLEAHRKTLAMTTPPIQLSKPTWPQLAQRNCYHFQHHWVPERHSGTVGTQSLGCDAKKCSVSWDKKRCLQCFFISNSMIIILLASLVQYFRTTPRSQISTYQHRAVMYWDI